MPRERSTVTGLLDDAPTCSRQNAGGLLLVIRGPDRGATVRVSEVPVRIGSGRGCDLLLTDATVSRMHFEVQVVGGEVIVTDRGSTNGCMINGLRVERAAIGFGTSIKLGHTVVKLVPDEEFVEPVPSQRAAFGTIVGADERMRQLFTLLEEAAPTDATVLIEGETGTGKELIAEEVHRHSRRRGGPFVVFDCGSVPPDLVSSILFGHVKGAFTSATSDRAGVFAAAHGGTLFLDEIGEMALELQPALLRALDKRTVCRIGATQHETFDVRIVAATNRELRGEIANKRFREDLYYRLAVLRVAVPALRERGRDIALLVEHFLATRGVSATTEDLERLTRHSWPGNVRELRNVLERACVLARDGRIQLEATLGTGAPPPRYTRRLDLPFKDAKNIVVEEFEREYLEDLLGRHRMSISSAAREAQIDRKHLRELMKKYGMSPQLDTMSPVGDR